MLKLFLLAKQPGLNILDVRLICVAFCRNNSRPSSRRTMRTKQSLLRWINRAPGWFAVLGWMRLFPDTPLPALPQLYDSQSTWKSTKADLESKVEDLEEDREMLQDKVEELKEEVSLPPPHHLKFSSLPRLTAPGNVVSCSLRRR